MKRKNKNKFPLLIWSILSQLGVSTPNNFSFATPLLKSSLANKAIITLVTEQTQNRADTKTRTETGKKFF